jgi:4-hydroxybenzoate polyprenyltransferase
MTIDRTETTALRGASRVDGRALILALRPKQWSKNAIVFAALVFDHHLGQGRSIGLAVGAFVAFCLASSATYLLNDLQDVESDRQHPTKRLRPIASGRVSNTQAWGMMFGLAACALALAFALRPAFCMVIVAYLMLMTAYTFLLKHLVLLDVFAISAGFVLRAAGGAVVLDVPISPWLYVCTVLLSLFIAFGKRRHELLLLDTIASSHRRNLNDYSSEMLDQFIIITAAAIVMAYSLYTFVAPNLPESHSMMLTIPFVLYAVFRYLFLIHRRDGGGTPEQLLFDDRMLLGSIALWGLASVLILYGPWS